MSYEGIERNAAGYEVATGVAWDEFEAVLQLRCLYGLGLDQSELEIRLRFEESPLLKGIAVTFEAHTRDGEGLGDCQHGSLGSWCDMNRFHVSLCHDFFPLLDSAGS